MILKLDKKDVVRTVEKYYKKISNLDSKAYMGLIYDKDSSQVYPYVKLEKRRGKFIDSDYLTEDDLKEVFGYTYNCKVNNISFDKEPYVNVNASNIDDNLYGMRLDISHLKKRKK